MKPQDFDKTKDALLGICEKAKESPFLARGRLFAEAFVENDDGVFRTNGRPEGFEKTHKILMSLQDTTGFSPQEIKATSAARATAGRAFNDVVNRQLSDLSQDLSKTTEAVKKAGQTDLYKNYAAALDAVKGSTDVTGIKAALEAGKVFAAGAQLQQQQAIAPQPAQERKPWYSRFMKSERSSNSQSDSKVDRLHLDQLLSCARGLNKVGDADLNLAQIKQRQQISSQAQTLASLAERGTETGLAAKHAELYVAAYDELKKCEQQPPSKSNGEKMMRLCSVVSQLTDPSNPLPVNVLAQVNKKLSPSGVPNVHQDAAKHAKALESNARAQMQIGTPSKSGNANDFDAEFKTARTHVSKSSPTAAKGEAPIRALNKDFDSARTHVSKSNPKTDASNVAADGPRSDIVSRMKGAMQAVRDQHAAKPEPVAETVSSKVSPR